MATQISTLQPGRSGPDATHNPPGRTPLPSQADEALADALAHLSAALALLAPHRAIWLAQLAAALDPRRLDPVPASLAPLLQGLAALDAARANLAAGSTALDTPLPKGA